MSLTLATRQARFARAEKSSWQNGLPTEPEICQLPTGCQLECRKINNLHQLAVGKAQLAKSTCQLNVSPSESISCVGNPVGGNSLPPTGGEETICSSPPCRRGSPLFAVESVPPNQGSLLALDLGTRMGWAVRTPDGRITSGTESFRPGRFEGGGMRYLRFRRWLENLKAAVGPIEAIYFEEVRRHAGVDAAHAYGGFLGQLTAWCEHHRIPYQGVPVGTIKKHVTGKGNASKMQIMQAMRQRGHHPADDNEADALALLYWVLDARSGGGI